MRFVMSPPNRDGFCELIVEYGAHGFQRKAEAGLVPEYGSMPVPDLKAAIGAAVANGRSKYQSADQATYTQNEVE